MTGLMQGRGLSLCAVRQHGLHLHAGQRRRDGARNLAEIRHQRPGLLHRVILTEGHKVNIAHVEAAADILRRRAQPVIGGYGQHQRPVIAQVALGPQQDGRIIDTAGQLFLLS